MRLICSRIKYVIEMMLHPNIMLVFSLIWFVLTRLDIDEVWRSCMDFFWFIIIWWNCITQKFVDKNNISCFVFFLASISVFEDGWIITPIIDELSRIQLLGAVSWIFYHTLPRLMPRSWTLPRADSLRIIPAQYLYIFFKVELALGLLGPVSLCIALLTGFAHHWINLLF